MIEPLLLKEPEEMTPEERLDALAEVLAEAFLHVAATGGLADLLEESGASSTGNQVDVPGKSLYPSILTGKEVGMNGTG